ncbi:hypothetical protein LNI90_01315 [Tenacibaculum dicentrarchi]|nr:hypothetical protein [Tenacibaculum dicentrarchi]MCD8423918.1 hypothetical protein [Tenacibaculum dicentrarchi]MCD8434389.1 hypothetical protein [Tenacibaculum dicentrarchi]MCD8436753.1 hypothetical protein [Tenacibaculum dicentrarchi]MCD8441223.1 hypothetical protein [Tenacibaculum dicentrarchi]
MIKQTIHFFIVVFAVSISSNSFAQLDASFGNTKNNSGSFNSIPNATKEVQKPTSLDFKNNNGFKNAHSKQQRKYKKKQAEKDFESKGVLTKAKIAEEQYLKAFKKINGRYVYPIIDQDLGSFTTKDKSITIICRDFQYPDGDKVTILVNNIPVVTNLILKKRYQSFKISLSQGINTINILALNQGTSGPNTAGFKIYNKTGTLLSANQWNLATGAKATIIIAKEKQ